jgi:hypothetical protein
VVAADLATKYVRAAGGVRFTEITVQVEAGSVVSVHCSGPRCPFFVKAAYTPTGGERNIAPMLHIGVLAAGTTVELWVEHENEVGRVFRGIIRRHTVTSRELCISQVDLRPRMCR